MVPDTSVEAAAPVVSDDCGTNDHSRGWNGGRLVKTALPTSVEVVEQLANSVKDELDIESHGADKFEAEDRMNLIPLGPWLLAQPNASFEPIIISST
jgi:hypothetical protein